VVVEAVVVVDNPSSPDRTRGAARVAAERLRVVALSRSHRYPRFPSALAREATVVPAASERPVQAVTALPVAIHPSVRKSFSSARLREEVVRVLVRLLDSRQQEQ
jgi:hypothetical protein